MENKEGTIIDLGCLALCSLYYFYRQFSKEATHYKIKRRELHRVNAESSKNHQIDFESLKKQNKKIAVILPNITQYQLQTDTYKLYYRQIRTNALSKVMAEGFTQNQSGGRFTITHKNEKITVDIKSCNIQTQVLQKKIQPNIIFQENKQKDAIYHSLTYTIGSLSNLALYGVLRYSIEEKRFILEPEFIVNALKSEQETVGIIASFWDDKIYNTTFKKIVIGFAMFSLGYLFLYKPLKSIWNRYKARSQGVSEGQFGYFKENVNFSARIEGKLMCEFCKARVISYIYECGHLVACEQCHRNNEGFKCAICGKKSKKFMKIFI